MFKKITLFLFMPIIITTLIACQSKEEKVSEENNMEGEELIVSIEPYYKPFSYKEEKNLLTGFDVDIIKEISKERGIKIKFKETSFDKVFSDVKNAKSDLGISAISITEERKKDFLFSDSYFNSFQLMMINKEDKIIGIENFKNKKIAFQAGTTSNDYAIENKNKNNWTLNSYNTIEKSIYSFIKKENDAVLADSPFIFEYINKNPIMNKKIILIKDEKMESEDFGIIINKKDKKMLEEINEGLKEIKNNGKYDQIYEKYFGTK